MFLDRTPTDDLIKEFNEECSKFFLFMQKNYYPGVRKYLVSSTALEMTKDTPNENKQREVLEKSKEELKKLKKDFSKILSSVTKYSEALDSKYKRMMGRSKNRIAKESDRGNADKIQEALEKHWDGEWDFNERKGIGNCKVDVNIDRFLAGKIPKKLIEDALNKIES